MGLFPISAVIGIMILTAAMTPDAIGESDSTVDRLKRGDSAAAADLMARYQHRLYRYLLRVVKEPAAAEDLFQQTWLQIIQKIRWYDSSRSFAAWMFAVARNLAIDHLRRQRESSLDAPDDSGRPAIDSVASETADAFQQLLQYERGVVLAAAISQLPAIHREILTLRFEENMKLEEIAAIAGIPLSTVKSRLARALENLRLMVDTKNL